ncbi:fatty acyl-CoA reductase wat-like [Spodoptera litura]|uniref:Fatty acyl-CoA reductase n=1 Tax=Spodoptera litura TaxID=69820 RepID=A0A9J7E4H0_SPOLT|nr:fatty acyl-CoA reductase wat-like [Spodoptera litura]
MDLAQEVEYKALASFEPVDKLMLQGSSDVQKFYSNEIVFLTGGSGFLGKQYIEKIFRSCAIQKMYVLIRPKKGKTIQDRIKLILSDPVFDKLRTVKPNFAEQIVPVEGDVADIRLGLSDKEWDVVAKDTSIIVHMAATIRFDSPIRVAVVTNVRGTREVISLAKDCKHIKSFIHVSTGFTHATASRIGTDLKEKFHPSPVSPAAIIGMVETMEDSRLDNITAELIKDWPNTYTFTKAIAEELIRTTAADLPVAIVKPPLVLTSYMEPSPGWADTSIMSGPCGVLIGVGLGLLRVFYLKSDLNLNIAPVDFVNNAIITASWDSIVNRPASDGIPIYTVSSTKCGIPWSYLANLTRSEELKHLACPKAVWYCYLLETQNNILYLFLFWLLHYIPAYVIDGICYVMGIKIKDIPSATKVYEKIYKVSKVFGYFMTNEWHFKDDNLVAMINRMSDEDKAIYNCDVNSINYKEYLKRMIVGLRKYIVKDGLVDSEKAYVKQKRLYYANWIFMILYIYVWFMIAFYMFKAVQYIVC